MIEVIILFIAIILGFLNVFGSEPLSDFQKEVWPSSENSQQTEVRTPDYIPEYTPSQESKPSVPLSQTAVKIVLGPYEGEVLNETNKVTFEFDWKDSFQDRENSRFETKVESFDKDWVPSYSKERTITLPAGPKEYTFMVRERGQTNQTPAERTFKINVSPYFKKLDISGLSTQYQNQPSLITISTSLNTEEQIHITGWSLKNVRDKIILSKGIEKYNPSSNYTPKDNIIIRQGDSIYISSAQTPIGPTQAFKINKCFGYLTTLYTFPISISKNCPSVEKKDISHLSSCCQKYILSAPSCDAQKDAYKVEESDCKAYISNNLNYEGCFIKHYQDSDFLGSQWQVYLNHNLAITGECNTLYLYDQNGLFVDKYSYGQAECQY